MASDSSTILPLQKYALVLLQQLIATPSFSKEEHQTADIIEQFLQSNGVTTNRLLNNVWAKNKFFDERKPYLLLNSHHDTVKPNKSYTLDPFLPDLQEGKLFGLGSNDAGGSLVALIAVFLYFYEAKDLKYNIVFAASAEEEISGKNGIEILLSSLPKIDFGIVGEPTQMQMAIAERGLLVLDVVTTGTAGHAARDEGENAIYKALSDIEWFKNYQFDKISPVLGKIKMSVTVMDTENKAHNVVPSQCRYVVDVRVNELYSFEEILSIIQSSIKGEVTPRSLRMRSTSINLEHPLIQAGLHLKKTYYGSPTTSDKALMPFPTLKMGPGDSARSHTADEFIYVDEINKGIELYLELLKNVIS